MKENGLEVTTIEDIRSGIETHGTGKSTKLNCDEIFFTISNISMTLNAFSCYKAICSRNSIYMYLLDLFSCLPNCHAYLAAVFGIIAAQVAVQLSLGLVTNLLFLDFLIG